MRMEQKIKRMKKVLKSNQNNKLFEAKMNLLNKKKIELFKSKRNKNKIIKNSLILSIQKEIQFNYAKENNNNNNKRRQYLINNEMQISIINNNKSKYLINPITNINNKIIQLPQNNLNNELIKDNCISIDYISKNIKDYSEEERDIYFISKIRQLQKDNKYKTDIIIDLQNKIKQKEDEFIKITKIEIVQLNDKIKKIFHEKEEKIKDIKRLETDIYNLKSAIEHLEIQINNFKK